MSELVAKLAPLALAATAGAVAVYWLSQAESPSRGTHDALHDIKAAWVKVRKTAGGRVDHAAFKEICLRTHGSKLTSKSRKSFVEFIDRTFDAAVGLMLQPGAPPKTDLGRHCFSCARTARPIELRP